MLSRGRGFTLIELMVVLGVMSVLAVMVVPRFEGTYRRTLLRAAARELAAALDLASSRAATTARIHRLRVDAPGGEWTIEERVEGGRFQPVTGVPGTAGRLDKGIQIRIEERLEGSAAESAEEPSPRSRDTLRPAEAARPKPARSEAPAGPSRETGARPGAGPSRGPVGTPPADDIRDAVKFRPDGTAEGREIILETEDGAALALRVHPSTGRVRIAELERRLEGSPGGRSRP